MKALLLIKNF